MKSLQAPLSDTKPVVSDTKKTAVLEVARVDVFGLPFCLTYIAFWQSISTICCPDRTGLWKGGGSIRQLLKPGDERLRPTCVLIQ
jgi:hypothetical protein